MSSQIPFVYKEKNKPTKGAVLCTYWQEVGMIRTLVGTPGFRSLSWLAKFLLALPHSNADTERVFSTVRKNVTNYRTEMEQSTLCALVSCKLNRSCDCFKLDTPKELLKKAKVSTMEYIEHTV